MESMEEKREVQDAATQTPELLEFPQPIQRAASSSSTSTLMRESTEQEPGAIPAINVSEAAARMQPVTIASVNRYHGPGSDDAQDSAYSETRADWMDFGAD
ncbi:unnamed protein product, partial [Mesorhabditis spiculigera]